MAVKNDELSYNLGETVDRLISVQYFMSGGGSALTRKPVTGVLYEAAREKAGAPLCHLAAKALADNVGRGDTVFITTGLIAPPYMIAEGDGPIANLPRWCGCILASPDPVATDVTIARLLGHDPDRLNFAREGELRGVGARTDIDYVGVPLEDV